MRLILDAVGNKSGGGATVLLELLAAIVEFDRIREVILLASPAALRKFEIPECRKLKIVDVPVAETGVGRFFWALRGIDYQTSKLEGDIFLGLNGFGCLKRRIPSFILIQQSIPYSREALCLYSAVTRLRMALIKGLTCRAIRAANHVMVQNEAMREIISQAAGVGFDRISAFTPGAPRLPYIAAEAPKLSSLRCRSKLGVLLYVGGDYPHKNLRVVAEGLRQIPEVQRIKWYATLPRSSWACRCGAAFGLGDLSREELYEAYRYATLLVMPSLTETVGLPMLEAMRIGTPVLAADRPYAHAVCQDAAVFFDPLSPSDFAAKLMQLSANVALRNQLTESGLALVRRRDELNPYRSMLTKMLGVADSMTG